MGNDNGGDLPIQGGLAIAVEMDQVGCESIGNCAEYGVGMAQVDTGRILPLQQQIGFRQPDALMASSNCACASKT